MDNAEHGFRECEKVALPQYFRGRDFQGNSGVHKILGINTIVVIEGWETGRTMARGIMREIERGEEIK